MKIERIECNIVRLVILLNVINIKCRKIYCRILEPNFKAHYLRFINSSAWHCNIEIINSDDYSRSSDWYLRNQPIPPL